MVIKKIVIFSFFITCLAHADEVGLRLDSAISPSNTSLWAFPTSPSAQGKMFQLVYDWEPFHESWYQSFYLEGAFGYRSWSDIFEYSSMAYEVSPGFKVNWGALVFKLSEGISWMPENSFNSTTYTGYQQVDAVTHLTIGLKDPKSGVGIYLDRSHYSNGSAYNNPSLDYSGFMIQIPTTW